MPATPELRRRFRPTPLPAWRTHVPLPGKNGLERTLAVEARGRRAGLRAAPRWRGAGDSVRATASPPAAPALRAPPPAGSGGPAGAGVPVPVPRHATLGSGGDLLSRAREGQVPSALRGLTALFGMGRGVALSQWPPKTSETKPLRRAFKTAQRKPIFAGITKNPSSPRPISTGLLRTSPCFQIRPINLVIFQGSYSLQGMGELISRSASRLDAFSGYPIRT